MRIVFGSGGAKFKHHDAFNSCGSLSLKAATQEQRYALAAVLRAFSECRCDDDVFIKLREAVDEASAVCEREHADALNASGDGPIISSGRMSCMSELTVSQRQFFVWLHANYPECVRYWNAETAEVKIESIEHAIAVASSGERIVLKCLLSIWWGSARDQMEIDITDLAIISPHKRAPIIDWLSNPFWP